MCRHVLHKYVVKTNIATITVIALEFTKPKGKVNDSSKSKILPKLESNALPIHISSMKNLHAGESLSKVLFYTLQS